ncbi:uncharacterized protein YndB with AHSA1/START domain [Desmospora profundinema]|uniref:Uncharacterized protein YndB with AHSA1/START domain n=1 Tax=Desmospora profundinema TaxID=1571184 RepID=A0ABU1IH24_9BACL|nr:uncharacterized protein YndB with AHSA1/START domain [Desmospora profundinema]
MKWILDREAHGGSPCTARMALIIKIKIVYTEIVKPERLVYNQGSEEDPEQFQVTVTFAEHGGRTELTMRMRFKTAAERDQAIEFGAIKGGKQTLDRLAEYLR